MAQETIRIGTRASALAQWQAEAVARAICACMPNVRVELRCISTAGDRALDEPLERIGDKGLFTKDLERALVCGEVDLCVHSMKDVPVELADGCTIAAMLPRTDVRDALVCGPRIRAASLAQLPAGARLGTGSLRRNAQLRANFPHIEPVPMRGNVDTRLAKLAGSAYDAALLAVAGLIRLGREDAISCRLPVCEMLPAAGQGAIGIEARVDDTRMASVCAQIDDAATSACVHAERYVLAALEGGCQVPLGVYARYENGEAVLDAGVFSIDGAKAVRAHMCAAAPCDAAVAAVEELLAGGAKEVLDALR